MIAKVTTDHWRYGESEESGNKPKLYAGQCVEVLYEGEVFHGNSVYVRTADGLVETAAQDALVPVDWPDWPGPRPPVRERPNFVSLPPHRSRR